MSGLSDNDLQILNVLAKEGLKMIDGQYGYFKDTWFNREQVQRVVEKLDKIDDEIRKEIGIT